MANQLIDVVIPVFNGAKTIHNAIESIQKQTVSNIRIVIVDDGSTDDTPRIVREIAAADPRVWVISQPNGGIVDARNAGLAPCQAEFVAWIDADDVAVPNRLEEQVSYLQAHPECVAVSCAVRHVDEDSRFLGTICRLHSPETADPAWVPAIEPLLIQSFLMARRSAMEAVSGYRYVLYSEDSDLCWRLQELGQLHNMETVLGDVRMHSGSVSSRSIINGRIMALSSQLAAISARRRRAGRPDLSFPKQAGARYVAAESLANIFAVGCKDLEQEEIDYVEIALAGKLLELTSYRPYELELADCRFIRSAIRKHLSRLPAANRAALARACSASAARLLHRGAFREAAALVPFLQYPATAMRLTFRAVASSALRVRLRRAIGREPTAQLK